MRTNRRDREGLRAVERKVAAEARDIISRAERAASRKRRKRGALIGGHCPSGGDRARTVWFVETSDLFGQVHELPPTRSATHPDRQ